MKSNYLFILINCLLISCKNNSQSKHIHSNEIDNLYFSKVDLTKDKISSEEYSKNFNLHKNKSLSIVFTLNKPGAYVYTDQMVTDYILPAILK
jgi:hypothetical protein